MLADLSLVDLLLIDLSPVDLLFVDLSLVDLFLTCQPLVVEPAYRIALTEPMQKSVIVRII